MCFYPETAMSCCEVYASNFKYRVSYHALGSCLSELLELQCSCLGCAQLLNSSSGLKALDILWLEFDTLTQRTADSHADVCRLSGHVKYGVLYTH